MVRAELLFKTGTGDVCGTAEETARTALGPKAVQQLRDKLNAETEALMIPLSETTALGFISELEGRAKWVVDADNLPALLAVRYGLDPAQEIVDGHVSTYVGSGDPKLLGLELRLDLPISWKQEAGKRPHVVSKWNDQNGTGLAIFMLMVQDVGQPMTAQDLADFTAADPREMLPDGANYLDGGTFILEGFNGIKMRYRMKVQRLDADLEQITDQYMLPLPSGKIVFLSCQVATPPDGPEKLEDRFTRFEPACYRMVNSLVLTSNY